MNLKTVTSSDFQNSAGHYLDQAAKGPVVITKYKRPSRVLVDYEEYERLKSFDTRKALSPHELDDDMATELQKGFQGRPTPELDHLLD